MIDVRHNHGERLVGKGAAVEGFKGAGCGKEGEPDGCDAAEHEEHSAVSVMAWVGASEEWMECAADNREGLFYAAVGGSE